eukprot:9289635-Pyramimonas_sp.AAC.1
MNQAIKIYAGDDEEDEEGDGDSDDGDYDHHDDRNSDEEEEENGRIQLRLLLSRSPHEPYLDRVGLSWAPVGHMPKHSHVTPRLFRGGWGR